MGPVVVHGGASSADQVHGWPHEPVAALDRNDLLATFSNYGAKSVHVAAPGRDAVISTFKVPGMDCPSEERTIRMALESSDAVIALAFDLPQRAGVAIGECWLYDEAGAVGLAAGAAMNAAPTDQSPASPGVRWRCASSPVSPEALRMRSRCSSTSRGSFRSTAT